VAEFNQESSQTAHATSGYTDKMNAVMLTRQESR
jgi:hypothetical protein